MRRWRSVPHNRFGWLILLGLGWCNTPLVVAAPPRQRLLRLARLEPPPPTAQKNPARDCELWPPKSFPAISDLYLLKLEYDCRNRTLAHQRHALASQEARQSTALAEKRDLPGIDEKNRWAEKEQSELDARQRELDAWRDEVFKRLQRAMPESGADPAAPRPGTLAETL